MFFSIQPGQIAEDRPLSPFTEALTERLRRTPDQDLCVLASSVRLEGVKQTPYAVFSSTFSEDHLSLLKPDKDMEAKAPEIHALVVGIDEYDHASRIYGAVADAEDIAASLQKFGARPDNVTILLDREARKARIQSAGRRMAERAAPGRSSSHILVMVIMSLI